MSLFKNIKRDKQFKLWLAELIIHRSSEQELTSLYQAFKLKLTPEQMTEMSKLQEKQK